MTETDDLTRVALMADHLDRITEGYDEARADLTDAVLNAHQEGFSMRRIAEAAGLSHQRVHQIIRRTDPP